MLFYFLITGNVWSQGITIGADLDHLKGALLDIKSQQADVLSNVTSDKGGLVLPRVKLVDLNTLQPFIAVTDPDWISNADEIKLLHVGLIVYNLSTVSPFVEGLYEWNGTEWIAITTGAANGLNKNGANIELGGILNKATNINMNGNSFSVTTGPAKRMTIDGSLQTDSLYITDISSTQGNSRILVRNIITGKIETAIDEVSTMCFLQSTDETSISKAAIEATYVVTWKYDDVVTNNLMEPITSFTGNRTYFEFSDYANVEISGYVGYIATNGTNTDSTIVVNAIIQVQRNNQSTWENYTSMRGVYPKDITAYRQTLNIPPAMVIGNPGDKIRMVVVLRPSNLGGGHDAPKIVVPYGTKFSKSLKIIAL
jgi:hypothetical protein